MFKELWQQIPVGMRVVWVISTVLVLSAMGLAVAALLKFVLRG